MILIISFYKWFLLRRFAGSSLEHPRPQVHHIDQSVWGHVSFLPNFFFFWGGGGGGGFFFLTPAPYTKKTPPKESFFHSQVAGNPKKRQFQDKSKAKKRLAFTWF